MKKGQSVADTNPSFKPVNRAQFHTQRIGDDLGPNQQMALPKQSQGFTTPKIPASDQGRTLPPLSKERNWNKTRPKGGK